MMPIDGYPDYWATEDGHIYSFKSHRILAERLTTGGYWRVNVTVEGGRQTIEVHRLVALAYLGPAGPGYRVKHGDKGRLDNSPENLKYATMSQIVQAR